MQVGASQCQPSLPHNEALFQSKSTYVIGHIDNCTSIDYQNSHKDFQSKFDQNFTSGAHHHDALCVFFLFVISIFAFISKLSQRISALGRSDVFSVMPWSCPEPEGCRAGAQRARWDHKDVRHPTHTSTSMTRADPGPGPPPPISAWRPRFFSTGAEPSSVGPNFVFSRNTDLSRCG